MFLEIITGALMVAVTSAVTAVIKPLFSWMRSKANEQKILEKSKIDDAILDALEIGVSNVSNKLRKELIAEDGSLTDGNKVEMVEAAIGDAKAVLLIKGIEIYREASQSALEALVRRLVDADNNHVSEDETE